MRNNTAQPQHIQAGAGETVGFRFCNAGGLLPGFNIGTATMHRQHRREMQAMFDSGMMSAASKDAVAGMDHSKMPGMNHGAMGHGGTNHGAMRRDGPNAVLVHSGKTAEMIVKSTRAATREFACNIPGHSECGMLGNVVFAR